MGFFNEYFFYNTLHYEASCYHQSERHTRHTTNTSLWKRLPFALGGFTGLVSGLIGIGGAVIIIPALVFLFKFSQHMAQGTTLTMMVLPIGILAAYSYYRAGNVDMKVALLMAAGFLIGGLFGGRLVSHVPEILLTRAFGVLIILIGIKMVLK